MWGLASGEDAVPVGLLLSRACAISLRDLVRRGPGSSVPVSPTPSPGARLLLGPACWECGHYRQRDHPGPGGTRPPSLQVSVCVRSLLGGQEVTAGPTGQRRGHGSTKTKLNDNDDVTWCPGWGPGPEIGLEGRTKKIGRKH